MTQQVVQKWEVILGLSGVNGLGCLINSWSFGSFNVHCTCLKKNWVQSCFLELLLVLLSTHRKIWQLWDCICVIKWRVERIPNCHWIIFSLSSYGIYKTLVNFTLKGNFLNVYKFEIEKNTVIITNRVFDKNIFILSTVRVSHLITIFWENTYT